MGILRMFLLIGGVAITAAGFSDHSGLLASLGALWLGAYCYLGERQRDREKR